MKRIPAEEISSGLHPWRTFPADKATNFDFKRHRAGASGGDEAIARPDGSP
jgi:hypothetical protein